MRCSRPRNRYNVVALTERRHRVLALGFPSKTSTEIAPDHPKLSDRASRLSSDNCAQTLINIALRKYWWYFHDALENGGNRFPLPAPQFY
jgi:hypothetical protein